MSTWVLSSARYSHRLHLLVLQVVASLGETLKTERSADDNDQERDAEERRMFPQEGVYGIWIERVGLERRHRRRRLHRLVVLRCYLFLLLIEQLVNLGSTEILLTVCLCLHRRHLPLLGSHDADQGVHEFGIGLESGSNIETRLVESRNQVEQRCRNAFLAAARIEARRAQFF